MRSAGDPCEERERGAVLVIVTVFFVVLVTIAAFLIDIASVRLDQRSIQTAADLAALSGASNLDLVLTGTPNSACTEAWAYLKRDLPGLAAAATFDCSPFATSPSCGAAVEQSETFTANGGSYTVTIETPVPDDDPMMYNFEGVQDSDGTACSRFGVQISQRQPFIFGPAVGTSSSGATVHAVARYIDSGDAKFPDLAALDPHACDAVNAGAGFIEAFAAQDANGNLVSPGLIYADSDGTGDSAGNCNNGHTVFDVNGQSASSADCFSSNISSAAGIMCAQPTLLLPGKIATYALTTGSTHAYRHGYNYFPTPTYLSKPLTREPIDSIYHCSRSDVPTSATCVDYIDQLTTAYSSTAMTPANLPPNWTIYPASGQSCQISGSTVIIRPDTYVDCPDSGGGVVISNAGTLEIQGEATGATVVFAGSISTSSNGNSFGIIDPVDGKALPDTTLSDYQNAPDTIIYLQNGGNLASSSGGTIVLPHTFVYSEQPSRTSGNLGCLSIGSGSTVTWSALAGNTTASKNLAKLMYWSEGNACASNGNNGGFKGSFFDGGAQFEMDGILFSPNADFTITGNSPVDARMVQFWINTINVTSSSSGLLLRPDPSDAIPSAGSVSLIR